MKDASLNWGISERRISALCSSGRIDGAVKASGVWLIPAGSKKPEDARIKSGKYKNWRRKRPALSDSFSDNMKNLQGTFAVEGMDISEDTVDNLCRVADGSLEYLKLIDEIKQKYIRGD